MDLQTALEVSATAHRTWMRSALEGVCARDRCTLEELAGALGVTRTSVWSWREGLSLPQLKTFLKLRALIDGRARVYRGRLAAA